MIGGNSPGGNLPGENFTSTIKNVWNRQKIRKFIKYKFSIRKLYFGTLVLATDFFQNTCFKESNNMVFERISKLQKTLVKNNVF